MEAFGFIYVCPWNTDYPCNLDNCDQKNIEANYGLYNITCWLDGGDNVTGSWVEEVAAICTMGSMLVLGLYGLYWCAKFIYPRWGGLLALICKYCKL